MKYYSELTQEDKERALDKLLRAKHLRFNCLTRAKVKWHGELLVCSVIKYYWLCNDLRCDIILDKDLESVIKGVYTGNLVQWDKEVVIPTRDSEDLRKSKQALETLLTSGKYYIFDNKCNAYPV